MIIDPHVVPDQLGSRYPAPFQAVVAGRCKKRVGDAAGLKNVGVNLVQLPPGSQSALRHWHTRQDEFIYVLEGELILITNAGEQRMTAGMMAGFPAGTADGHHLVNRSDALAVYLEVGDRTVGDEVYYPEHDLMVADRGQGYVFTHRDGRPY